MAANKSDSSVIIIKKKRGGGHAAAHGGAWKVAYADFVTAMMALFMVMWLMGADEETKASIESYFNNAANSNTKFSSSESINKNGRMLAGDASNRTDGDQGRFEEELVQKPSSTAPVYIEEQQTLQDLANSYDGSAFTKDTEGDKVKFNIPGGVQFTAGSNVIPASAHKALARLAQVFKGHDGTIMVEGYADAGQDWALAFGRAMSIRNYLIREGGVAAEKLIPVAAFQGPGRKVANANTPADEKNGSVRFVLKRTR